MAKFNINDLLNNKSKEEKINTFKIKYINIDDLAPDDRNFYDVSDVEELKESIRMFGLQQNLVVRQEGDKYKIISGHRRLKALKDLVEEGNEGFETIPCKVEIDTDDIKTELQLIFANSTSRELSDYEKTQQVVRMKELLIELKNSGIKITGRLRDIVADTLKVSPTQVARMESINTNLSNEFKEEFKESKVNMSTAYELSGLNEKKQKEVFKEYEEKGSLSIKDVKQKKKEDRIESESDACVKLKELNKEINTKLKDEYGKIEEDYKKLEEQSRAEYKEETAINITNYERIKNLSIEEMAEEIKLIANWYRKQKIKAEQNDNFYIDYLKSSAKTKEEE